MFTESDRYKIIRAVEKFWLHLILLFGLALTITPFVWMVSTSLKEGGGIFTYPPQWIPENPTLEWYRQLFRDVDFFLHFKNSLIVSISITLCNLFLCSLAGYAFAKLRFMGRDRIFTLLMATLMIPGQILMIPVFLFLKQLG
ncbi:MAG: carbohydrate ABC transporter permease, partial [Elusimicrobia bacterium]|nr:carbohydrate ABC transporter permease [Elusimicrobiota bacterium]